MLKSLAQPSKRILIADDDPVIRHLVTSIVSKEGYSVVVANDGDEAYKLLQRDADFRAAIFDMMMPGIKGLDLLRYMRTEKRLLRIPVMMITSEKDLTLMTDLFAAGATAILPKPFSTLQIQTILQMLVNQQQRNSGPLSKYPMMGYNRGVAIRT
jgi:CheY-like chemotaxis protein